MRLLRAVAAVVTPPLLFGCSALISTSDLAGGDNATVDASEGGSSEAGGVDAGGVDGGDAADGPRGTVDGGVVWNVNGHTYVVVRGSVTWTEANTQAIALGGHLVTLTSSEENLFVYGLLGGNSSRVCIGAVQAPGSPEPAGGWGWVTGEPWSFTAWASGQPDDSGGEDIAIFSASTPGAVWGDYARSSSTSGFVVEFE